jgi:hypothetical protein
MSEVKFHHGRWGLAHPFFLILLTRAPCPCLCGFWRDRGGALHLDDHLLNLNTIPAWICFGPPALVPPYRFPFASKLTPAVISAPST